MHPLRKLRESGNPTPAQVSELLAENIVFHSPILVRPIEGREVIAAIFAQSSSTRGSGTYTAEFKLNERTTFLRWVGTMDGHKFESLEVIVDNEQGLIVERTIALRPYPALKLFREAMHASLKDKLPPDVWDYPTPQCDRDGTFQIGSTQESGWCWSLAATSALLPDLVAKYFQPDGVATVTGDREVVTELLKFPFNFIFFTGSTSTGKVIARAAAENLTPALLELGGQNPALVDETANIPDAAKKIVWGKMAWGGQWCTSPGYAYVHESVAEAFVAEAKAVLITLYGKDPKANPDYSRIIGPREVSRLAALIDPTIVYPVSWDEPIMEDEIFGPVLPILTYRTLDEALGRISAAPHPLAAYIFSRSESAIDRFVGELSFGGSAVNQANIHLLVETMPFGGVGPAGMGHYYGKYGFDMLTHAKSILISPPDAAIEHLFPTYSPEKNAELKMWFEY